MKIILWLLMAAVSTSAQAQPTAFDNILKTMVNSKGEVNYKLLHNQPQKLETYLATLAKADVKGLSKNGQKALWMNAYNAYTLKVIIDHYPLKSIEEIKVNGKTAWEIPLAKVGGKTYTLNHIEHEILLKEFNDYRIHAGINCASFSCPVLLNQPFTEANVNELLEAAFSGFVNDPQRNKISANHLQLSQIFNWFKEDFAAAGGAVAVVKKYAKTPVNAKPKVSYLAYNWALNGQG